MTNLKTATVVASKATNFFSKPTKKPEEPAKKRGRPKTENKNKKEIKLSISISKQQKEILEKALKNYISSKKDDIFFKPISMNEFIETILFSNNELKKLI